MTAGIGIIGTGHLAGYLVAGWRRAASDLEITLSPRNVQRAADLAARFDARVAPHNQAIADAAEIILLSTRPADAVPACEALAFRSNQTVISVAAGVPLSDLAPAVTPACAVRAMPISCAAINESPTLLHPAEPHVQALFSLLGPVHVVSNEKQFTPASAISAFYAWLYALFDVAVTWARDAGVPDEIARNLVLETARGAAGMGLADPTKRLGEMLDSLATPGGISELGLKMLDQREGLAVWRAALDLVLARLQSPE